MATIGQAELKRDYPVTEGLTAGTTKQEGTEENLVADEDKTLMQHWGDI